MTNPQNSTQSHLYHNIQAARRQAIIFFNSLKTPQGYKYTSTHDVKRYLAATLYGTWSAVLGLNLLGEIDKWSDGQKAWAIESLLAHRREDNTFLGIGLEHQRNSKSLEYLILHCTNYTHGAMLVLNPNYDFETPYLHRFLDGNNLAHWLNGRSLLRPWEEGNNIVNVASYLALCNDHGEPRALPRLEQMLEWHNKYQNPQTGGFDAFPKANYKNMTQALAGAVHNYHIHLYLGKSYRHVDVITEWLTIFLMRGMLTSCLSIDFVELATRSLSQTKDSQGLVLALTYHAHALLEAQRFDGGWIENEQGKPSIGAGFKDSESSSISYGTWFRLCSLGMISIVLLKDDKENWTFRKTLGMGYAPNNWPELPAVSVEYPSSLWQLKRKRKSFPFYAKRRIIEIGKKFI